MANCKDCGKEILWLKHKDTGKAAPIEAEKVLKGNIVISERSGQYRIVNGEEYEKAVVKEIPLHISHFARCPNAAGFRNRG